jgi:hypothetical protein
VSQADVACVARENVSLLKAVSAKAYTSKFAAPVVMGNNDSGQIAQTFLRWLYNQTKKHYTSLYGHEVLHCLGEIWGASIYLMIFFC